jgi:hypothetical protein
MHTRTDPTSKAETAKSVVDKPGVTSLHEPFRFESIWVREYFRIDHDCPDAEEVSDKLITQSTR